MWRMREWQVEQLAQEAEWCRRYAAINSVGLRKIVKKHDKRCGNRKGYEFLQARPIAPVTPRCRLAPRLAGMLCAVLLVACSIHEARLHRERMHVENTVCCTCRCIWAHTWPSAACGEVVMARPTRRVGQEV